MVHRSLAVTLCTTAALVLGGCSSDVSDDGDDDVPTAGSGFGDIAGIETESCFSLALTASQIPVVSSGPNASETDLDDSVATLDGVLPDDLLDELAIMASVARDALSLSQEEADALFESSTYTDASTPVIDYLHEACE